MVKKEESKKRRLKGRVVSDRMEKTIVVEIERSRIHPLYQKREKFQKRILADDGKKIAKQGDLVLIEACRPLSKKKSFRVIRKVKR